LIKLPFIETVFHILNRNLPQGTKVWPPGSLDINPFDYLSVAYLGEVLTDPLTKKMEVNRSSHKKKWRSSHKKKWRSRATSPGRPPREPAAPLGPG
jgi:hypothetical protein